MADTEQKRQGGVKEAAQLLMRLSPTVILKLLGRHETSPCPLSGMLQNYLQDPAQVLLLNIAFKSLLWGNSVALSEADQCALDRDGVMCADDMLDIHPTHLFTTIRSLPNSEPNNAFAFALETGKYVTIDRNTALETFALQHKALVFKQKCSTINRTPTVMVEALLANLDSRVEWRCVVWWSCMLVYYQKHSKDDAHAVLAHENLVIARRKQAATRCKLRIQREKDTEKTLTAGKRQTAQNAAAALLLHADVLDKLHTTKAAREASRMGFRRLRSPSTRKTAETATRLHNAQMMRLETVEAHAQAQVTRTAVLADKAETSLVSHRLQTMRNARLDTEIDTDVSAKLQVIMWGEQVPNHLRTHWGALEGVKKYTTGNPPTIHQLETHWHSVCACIMNCPDSQSALLVGEAIWSVCFEHLFSSAAQKKQVNHQLCWQHNVLRYVRAVSVVCMVKKDKVLEAVKPVPVHANTLP